MALMQLLCTTDMYGKNIAFITVMQFILDRVIYALVREYSCEQQRTKEHLPISLLLAMYPLVAQSPFFPWGFCVALMTKARTSWELLLAGGFSTITSAIGSTGLLKCPMAMAYIDSIPGLSALANEDTVWAETCCNMDHWGVGGNQSPLIKYQWLPVPIPNCHVCS